MGEYYGNIINTRLFNVYDSKIDLNQIEFVVYRLVNDVPQISMILTPNTVIVYAKKKWLHVTSFKTRSQGPIRTFEIT